MGIIFKYPVGATPLDPDEAAGLIPGHITTQGELNEWESNNIHKAEDWAFSKKDLDVLSLGFMQDLHKKMLSETWRWAGEIRKTEKNIGVAPENIRVGVRDLCDDVRAQLEYGSFPLREIAARFHHRLVYIHPFPNGNGRLCRMVADLFLVQNNDERFAWGKGPLIDDGEARDLYIAALREADGKNYGPLLKFLGCEQPAS